MLTKVSSFSRPSNSFKMAEFVIRRTKISQFKLTVNRVNQKVLGVITTPSCIVIQRNVRVNISCRKSSSKVFFGFYSNLVNVIFTITFAFYYFFTDENGHEDKIIIVINIR